MKRISLNVPTTLYDALNDLASQSHMPMSLYTRMLIFQAFKIGPELEEVKKRVDELQTVVNGFADAILDVTPEDLIEEAMTADHQDAKYV